MTLTSDKRAAQWNFSFHTPLTDPFMGQVFVDTHGAVHFALANLSTTIRLTMSPRELDEFRQLLDVASEHAQTVIADRYPTIVTEE
jgi:hypothetical protein